MGSACVFAALPVVRLVPVFTLGFSQSVKQYLREYCPLALMAN